MNQVEEIGFKSRVQAALTGVFQTINIHCSVVRFEELGPKFYTVELDLNGHIRLFALVYDGLNGCRVWLDSGSVYHLLIQPTLEKYTREHPWILGV